MTTPDLVHRGHRGNPMASFGQLEILVDARRSTDDPVRSTSAVVSGPRALVGVNASAWRIQATNTVGDTGTAAAETAYVLSGVFDGANSFLRANGVVQAAGDVGAAGLDHFKIGGANGSGADWNGLLGLLAIYRGRLRTDAYPAVERFLNRDWNLGMTL